jgi:hypothetical protein
MTRPGRQLGINGVRRAERTLGGHGGAAGRAPVRGRLHPQPDEGGNRAATDAGALVPNAR